MKAPESRSIENVYRNENISVMQYAISAIVRLYRMPASLEGAILNDWPIKYTRKQAESDHEAMTSMAHYPVSKKYIAMAKAENG